MFSIETNMGRSTIQSIHTTEVADHAIYFFLDVLKAMRPTESARLMLDGKVMARKTPKRSFIADEWK